MTQSGHGEKKFSASSQLRDLNRSATNIPSPCKTANIALPPSRQSRPDGIFGKDRTFRDANGMSALPPEADIRRLSYHVRFVPKADIASDDSFV
jgi:hypothetical protein